VTATVAGVASLIRGVHHRVPGISVLHLMIALCSRCHAKVHHTKAVLSEMSPLLLILWREQHPHGHEQIFFDFNVREPAPQAVPLFPDNGKGEGVDEA
jgi:hypothetical protein